jgi:hypothetical protein
LTSILHEYVRQGRRADLSDSESALLHCEGDLPVTIASAPDAETVMFFAEAGFVPGANLLPDGGWIALPEIAPGDPAVAQRTCTKVYDQRTGAVALTRFAAATSLHGQAVVELMEQFEAELAELRATVNELEISHEAQADAAVST